jgi:type IV pilus assembly protein PilW
VKRKSSRMNHHLRHRAAGFSLVELMVAMLISLLLGAAAVSLFLSNKRVYGATEGVGRLQENARIAFELMARDIREAGGNPCDVRMKIVHVVDSTSWWVNYDAGISGFNDGGLAGSAPGTDAIRIQYFETTPVETTGDMVGPTDSVPVNNATSITPGQILMACGFFPPTSAGPGPIFDVIDTAAIFSAGVSGGALTHTEADGNTSNDFTDASQAVPVKFPAGSSIGSLRALQWYVAENGEGGTSLFRSQLGYGGGAPAMGTPEEIIPDVTDMQITYLEDDTWTTGLPANWSAVTAVQVELELEARDSRVGAVNGEPLSRKLVHVIALRNKL